MARPRKNAGGKSAMERMEETFWQMMEEMPFAQMTCKELYGRAGVSHNTFYYYFGNMEDVAEKMFERAAIKEMPMLVLGSLAAGESYLDTIADIPNIEERFHKIKVMAASDADTLKRYEYETAVNIWFPLLGITTADLTPEDMVDINFALGGAIAVLASEYVTSPAEMFAFAQRKVGQGVVGKLQELKARGAKA